MNRINESYLSINFYEFDCDPVIITDLVQIKPTKSGVKGDKLKTDGRPLKHNYWCYEEKFITNTFIEDLVDDFFQRIVIPEKDKLKSAAGLGVAELKVVQYYYDGYNPGYHFKKEVLGITSEINFDIDIDVYCLTNASE